MTNNQLVYNIHDLYKNSKVCISVYFHSPRFSIGTRNYPGIDSRKVFWVSFFTFTVSFIIYL
jgi:hypothetical protein